MPLVKTHWHWLTIGKHCLHWGILLVPLIEPIGIGKPLVKYGWYWGIQLVPLVEPIGIG